MNKVVRDTMLTAQHNLDALFFNKDACFRGVYEQVQSAYPDRHDQLLVLLAYYVSKEHRRIVEAEAARAAYLDSLLTPQEGEPVH